MTSNDNDTHVYEAVMDNSRYDEQDGPIRHVTFQIPDQYSSPAVSCVSINDDMSMGENNTHNEDERQVVCESPSEYSPLLGKPNGRYHDNRTDEENKCMEDYHTIEPCGVQTTWVKEVKILLASSVPLVLTFLLQNSINLASIFAVGRMGKVELGAVSLAITTLHITFIAPAQGLASSLDTSCAQAYGNRRYHLVGLQCQRVTLLCLCLSIPIAILWLFSEPLLGFVVTNPRSAHLTAKYLRVMIFSMPGVIVFETGKRLLQAQGLFRATTYILLLAAPVNIFINWLLISQFNMGFIGAPVAVMVTRNLLPLFLVLYIRFINGSQCWGGLSIRALANWKPMMKLALPSMIMVEAEFLAFEVITLLCSTLGTGHLAAWGIIASLNTVSWQVPFAMSIAASSRIANLIGAGSPEAAKITARMAFAGTLLVSTTILVTCVAARFYLPHLFTSDPSVIRLTAQVLPFTAVMQFFDGISTGAHGLLRGIGRQSIGGVANLFSYYVISLPVSIFLGFNMDWKLQGFSSGLTVGLITVSLIEYAYLIKTDWHKAAKEAEARNAQG